jgi:thiamine kinase-like enzyme
MHEIITDIFSKISPDEQIISIEVFSKPTTNHTYIVNFRHSKYFCRIPNNKTTEIVDFQLEKNNLLETVKYGFAIEPIYIDDKGIIVKPFIENAEIVNLDSNFIRKAANLLSKFHKSNIAFENRIDCFRAFDKYFGMLEDQKKFEKLKLEISNIETEYNTLPLSLAPCHNDLNLGNFLQCTQELFLIDLEYAGQNDPAWDIAYLFYYAGFNESQRAEFLQAYDNNCYSDELWVRKIEMLTLLVEGVVMVWREVVK